MTKEKFIKELTYNLRYLPKTDRQNELIYYDNLDNYNLDPISIANEIYQKRNLKIVIRPKIKFFKAINIIVSNLKSKDILFFLYLLLLLIIIKVPFIYLRDIIITLFNDKFQNDNIYILWALFNEILYAITGIMVSIRLIKNKALKEK